MDKKTEINFIGKYGLIDNISKKFVNHRKDTVLSIGDDAAIVKSRNKEVLISSDLMVEGVHFDLIYFPLRHIGYKAIIKSISNIAAMNAFPSHITVNIGISNKFYVEDIEEIYIGIKKACEEYNLDLIGGDTCPSNKGLIISITTLGFGDKEELVSRTYAQEKDIICITGSLGSAYLGQQILNREKKIFLEDPNIKPSFTKYESLVSKQLLPKARIDIITSLQEKGIVPTSMIDISGGLGSELLHLSKMSKKKVRVFEEKIPIESLAYECCEEFELNPLVAAFNGGEDYELLFTINQKDYDKIRDIKDISYIGFIDSEEAENVLILKSGNKVNIEAQGWKI